MTVDCLLEVVNGIFSAHGVSPLLKRTLRYYTSQGIVPRPLGSPKFARYAYPHIIAIIASRALQDQGNKLEVIVQEMKQLKTDTSGLELLAQNWLQKQSGGAPVKMPKVAESKAAYADAPNSGTKAYKLTPHSTLIIDGAQDLATELKRVQEAVKGLRP